MRKLLAPVVTGLALAALACGAAAEDRAKPDLGAGPHRDRVQQESGEGKPHRGMEVPQPAGASTGSSAVQPATTPATTPDDAHMEQLRREDERKASEAKEKMKKKPGYKEEVPAPRASGAQATHN